MNITQVTEKRDKKSLPQRLLLSAKKEVYSECLYLYGFYALCKIISYHEKYENFEECKIIYDVLKEHNALVEDNLPTRFDEKAKKYLQKSLEESKIRFSTYRLCEYVVAIKKRIQEVEEVVYE